MSSGKGSAGSNLTGSFNTSRNGDGYREHWASGDLADWRNSSFLILTAGTTPIIEISSNEARIRWASSDSNAVFTSCRVDGHFSDVSRDLQYVGTFLQTGTTDTITITLTVYARSPGGALKGPFTATAVATQGGTNPETLVFDLKNAQDSNDDYIEPGDQLTVSLTPSTHTTDALTFYGGVFQRRRNPGLTDLDERNASYS